MEVIPGLEATRGIHGPEAILGIHGREATHGTHGPEAILGIHGREATHGTHGVTRDTRATMGVTVVAIMEAITVATRVTMETTRDTMGTTRPTMGATLRATFTILPTSIVTLIRITRPYATCT